METIPMNAQNDQLPALAPARCWAPSFRITEDWKRLEIIVRGHAVELNRDEVLALHEATGEALALLAQDA